MNMDYKTKGYLKYRQTLSDDFGRRKPKFECVSPHAPTIDEIREMQIDLGYHPAGYSGPWNIASEVTKGGYTTVWECSGNAD